jgi:SagB-type dehydrogenase family enzyme
MGRATLPGPRQDGDTAVERCIWRRRSVRGFRDRALAPEQLGQALWAAQGVTSADARRAVPSAGALYPLELYVAVWKIISLAPGIYRYRPEGHQLLPVISDHRRETLVDTAHGQEWIATAPAIVCIAAVFERTTMKYGSRGRGYVYMEAGHAAESLILQAVALDLAATVVGAFSDDGVARLLRLKPDETPLCLIPVGAP